MLTSEDLQQRTKQALEAEEKLSKLKAKHIEEKKAIFEEAEKEAAKKKDAHNAVKLQLKEVERSLTESLTTEKKLRADLQRAEEETVKLTTTLTQSTVQLSDVSQQAYSHQLNLFMQRLTGSVYLLMFVLTEII